MAFGGSSTRATHSSRRHASHAAYLRRAHTAMHACTYLRRAQPYSHFPSLSLLYLILSLVSLTSGKTNYTTIVGVVVEGGQLVVRLLQPPRGGASPSLKPNPTRAFLVLTLQRARPTCSLGESSLAHVRHLALAVARWLRLSFRFHRNCFLSSGERVLLRIYSNLDW